MKREINPVVGGIVLVIILIVIGAFMWSRTIYDSGQVSPEAKQSKASKKNK